DSLRSLSEEVRRRGGLLPSIYESQAGDAPRFCTALVSRDLLTAWLADLSRRAGATAAARSIERLEVEMPVIPQRPRSPVDATSSAERGPRLESRSDVLIGVIDSGCPFAHLQLRDNTGSGTRVLGLWVQDETSGFTPIGWRPPDLGYGCEVTRAELN